MTELDFLHYLQKLRNQFYPRRKSGTYPEEISVKQGERADLTSLRTMFYYVLGYLEGGIAALEDDQGNEEGIDNPERVRMDRNNSAAGTDEVIDSYRSYLLGNDAEGMSNDEAKSAMRSIVLDRERHARIDELCNFMADSTMPRHYREKLLGRLDQLEQESIIPS